MVSYYRQLHVSALRWPSSGWLSWALLVQIVHFYIVVDTQRGCHTLKLNTLSLYQDIYFNFL
jgi:hypothetical protein